MEFRVYKLIALTVAVMGIAATIILWIYYESPYLSVSNLVNSRPLLEIATSSFSFSNQNESQNAAAPIFKVADRKPKPELKTSEQIINPIKNRISNAVKEVSPKSFEELINSSVIQLYCGNLDTGNNIFSNIDRGTGIIIDDKGEILTNRHVIYDSNTKTVKNCFVLKSPFPNIKSEMPKIYYETEVIKYPAKEEVSDMFSKDKYYNDFAILKISGKPGSDSNINLLLGFNYAAPTDYSVLENSSTTFNFLPIDWNYQPKENDMLITLGYGIDASHVANQITSTTGHLYANIDINQNDKPQILLIESNATAGFSGGALINPKSKGLIGLISWITAGDIGNKYTVAIFRDFLREMMMSDLNFDLKH